MGIRWRERILVSSSLTNILYTLLHLVGGYCLAQRYIPGGLCVFVGVGLPIVLQVIDERNIAYKISSEAIQGSYIAYQIPLPCIQSTVTAEHFKAAVEV